MSDPEANPLTVPFCKKDSTFSSYLKEIPYIYLFYHLRSYQLFLLTIFSFDLGSNNPPRGMMSKVPPVKFAQLADYWVEYQ